MSYMAFELDINTACVREFPQTRGVFEISALLPAHAQPLPTDPIGSTTVTFSGAQMGTEIHVYLPDGTELTGTEFAGTDEALSWPVYTAGSPNNTVQITLIKRGLRWQKFAYTSKLGNQTIPIFPQIDLAYKNPT